MSRIDAYSVYQNQYYDSTVKNNKAKEAGKTDKTNKTEKKNHLQLSESAKKLLEELKKTYGDTDFIVADYKSEEEAAAYLARGTKEYSVLIEPELLEEMAADEEAKEKYLGIMKDARAQLNDMKEKLGEKGEEVTRLGVTIGKDGTLSYFAELEKLSEKQRERIEKSRENKKAEAKEAEARQEEKTKEIKQKEKAEELRQEERKAEKAQEEETAVKSQKPDEIKKALVQADTIEELLEKIQSVDWEKIQAEKRPQNGSRFECSI